MTFGAWPHGRSGGGGSAPAKVPALQDVTLFGGATAAWAMQATGLSVFDTSDRTGNGHNLQPPANNVFVQDIVPGKAVFNPWTPQSNGVPGNLGPAQFAGAVTVTARVMLSATYTFTNDAWIFSDGNYDTGLNTTFGFLSWNAASGGKMICYWEPGSVVTNSTLSIPKDGKWHFVSAARASNGKTIEFGVDGVYATVTASAGPGAGTPNAIEIAGHQGEAPASGTHPGPVADVVVWPVALTQAQVNVLRAQAMGL